MTYPPEYLDQLDALCAEHVMGWPINGKNDVVAFPSASIATRTSRPLLASVMPTTVIRWTDDDTWDFWSPTRDGNAMLEVWEKTRDNVLAAYPCDADDDAIEAWKCKYEKDGEMHTIYADTMPLAVVLAALRAKSVPLPPLPGGEG